ncbi:hypothetical protein ACWDBD_50110 [Streptomyces sp. NPDC001118]
MKSSPPKDDGSTVCALFTPAEFWPQRREVHQFDEHLPDHSNQPSDTVGTSSEGRVSHMVNAVPSGARSFDAPAAQVPGRHLVIEDLDSAGQCESVMFTICIIQPPVTDGRGQFVR